MSDRERRAVRVAVKTFGCKVNQVDSEMIVARLAADGIVLAEAHEADAIVVNTCCVTAEAEKKARKAVRRALRAVSEPHVIVTGCLASVSPGSVGADGGRIIVEADKDRVPERIAGALGLGASGGASIPRTSAGSRTRAMVKVEDGCDAGCTYCIVPTARGNPRSIPLETVLQEVRVLVGGGAAEVVLTGVNIGSYQDSGRDLSDLVYEVAGTGVSRLRLSSIEPPDLGGRLIGTLASLETLCPHLHVPLQSGSDRVLAAMGRGYDAETYARTIGTAREAIPGLAVTTDVMTGFPGETREDLDATMDLLRGLEGTVSKVHVFPFSPRPGTPAAGMPRQVPAEVRRARAAEVRVLGDSMRRSYMESRLGERADALIERVAGGVGEGTTGDYLKVDVVRRGLVIGAVEDVVLRSVDGFRMSAA